MSTKRGTRAPSPRRRKIKRLLVGSAIALPALVLLLWIAVHRVEWLGPMIANGLRAVIGPDRVAKLEDFAYGVEDRYNRWSRKDEQPKAYWDVPEEDPQPAAQPASADGGAPSLPAFRPKDVGPVHEKWSAPGDGQWVAIKDPRRPDEKPYLFKTLLHPDKFRSWAELFVVAVDLRRTELYPMAGYREPKSFEKEGMKYERKAAIPAEHHEELLAAFNGGFMTEHGYYGMKVDGVTLVKPRESACTIVQYDDGSVEIATWKTIAEKEPRMKWYRQAPGCMYEDGKMHVGLAAPDSRAWGATLDGETVIRRSAVGLDPDGDVLYVGISNHTTARAIAEGMHHAGAGDVAQLDVNWSYPKFVLFEPGEAGPERKAVPLAQGFEHSEDEYIRKRAYRDFFYLVRNPDRRTAKN
jgi:hypothetical protein